MIEFPDTIKQKTFAALNGDAAAMGSLFEWFRPRLYAHALRVCVTLHWRKMLCRILL